MIYLAAGDRPSAEAVWRDLDELASRTQDAEALMWPLQLQALRATLDGDLQAAVAAAASFGERAEELGMAERGRLYAIGLAFRPLLYMGDVILDTEWCAGVALPWMRTAPDLGEYSRLRSRCSGRPRRFAGDRRAAAWEWPPSTRT